jgi:TusA-related sulfurtransferase
MCPIPLLKLKKSIEENKSESILLITDHSCVATSIEQYLNLELYEFTINEPMNGIFEIEVKLK